MIFRRMFEFLKIISLHLKEWNKTSYCHLIYELIDRSFIVISYSLAVPYIFNDSLIFCITKIIIITAVFYESNVKLMST